MRSEYLCLLFLPVELSYARFQSYKVSVEEPSQESCPSSCTVSGGESKCDDRNEAGCKPYLNDRFPSIAVRESAPAIAAEELYTNLVFTVSH